mgnify:CR=1 FL=1
MNLKGLTEQRAEKQTEMETLLNKVEAEQRAFTDEENELFLFDLHLVTRDDAQRLASSIAHAIKKCIGVNGYEGTVSFSIGVIENFQFYHDFDSIIKK